MAAHSTCAVACLSHSLYCSSAEFLRVRSMGPILFRQPDVSRNALSFTAVLSFFLFLQGHGIQQTRRHRRSQDFLCGGALFLTKNLMTFFKSSPSFPCSYALYIVSTCPSFLSHLRGGCTSPNSPHFCLVSIKIA